MSSGFVSHGVIRLCSSRVTIPTCHTITSQSSSGRTDCLGSVDGASCSDSIERATSGGRSAGSRQSARVTRERETDGGRMRGGDSARCERRV